MIFTIRDLPEKPVGSVQEGAAESLRVAKIARQTIRKLPALSEFQPFGSPARWPVFTRMDWTAACCFELFRILAQAFAKDNPEPDISGF